MTEEAAASDWAEKQVKKWLSDIERSQRYGHNPIELSIIRGEYREALISKNEAKIQAAKTALAAKGFRTVNIYRGDYKASHSLEDIDESFVILVLDAVHPTAI